MASRAISVRLSDDAARALEALESTGLTPSEAIRQALIDSARRLGRESLALEAKRLAADPEDRAAVADLRAFMDTLRAER
jgi:predicted transcriptional regulator